MRSINVRYLLTFYLLISSASVSVTLWDFFLNKTRDFLDDAQGFRGITTLGALHLPLPATPLKVPVLRTTFSTLWWLVTFKLIRRWQKTSSHCIINLKSSSKHNCGQYNAISEGQQTYFCYGISPTQLAQSDLTESQLCETDFLPCDVMHKRGLCRHAMSVCLSRSWIVSKLINISKIFSPLGTPIILVFPCHMA